LLIFTALSLSLLPGVAAQSGPAGLRVTEVFPASESVAEVNSDVVAFFNRPVVPLTTSMDSADLPVPFTLEPAVEGTGRWLNTSIYQFTPQRGLAGGVTYRVVFNPELKATDGTILADAPDIRFETVPPSIVEIFPAPDALNVPLDRSIVYRFSQPVDREMAERAFFLRRAGSAQRVPGVFIWSENDTRLVFNPDENLLISTGYEMGFDGIVSGAGGGSGLANDTLTSTFTTVPLPAVISTRPFDGQTFVQPDDYFGMSFNFVSPMNPSTLGDLFTVEPEPENGVRGFYNDYFNSYTLSFELEAATTYTVRMAAGAEDAFGNVLDSPLSVTFTTADYPSQVNMRVSGAVGLYNVAREDVGFYLTYRNTENIRVDAYKLSTQDLVIAAAEDPFYSPYSSYVPFDPPLSSVIIPGVDDPNQWRFQYVDLADTLSGELASAVPECPGSLPPRLSVGASALVVTSPDPLRARSAPAVGEIVDLLYRGYALQVVGGPVCENNLLWWQVRLRDGSSAWVAESNTTEYFVESPQQPAAVPTAAPVDRVEPGIYYVEVSNETNTENIMGNRVMGHFMAVSTASLTVKASAQQTLVWATDLNTGLPLPGVPVALYVSASSEAPPSFVASVTTDADGVAVFEDVPANNLYEMRLAVLNNGQHFGVGMTAWSEGISPYMFGVQSDFYPQAYTSYIYTDRPIYRPGQTVYFKGITRRKDDTAYTPPTIETVTVQALDFSGNSVFQEEVPVSAYGSFNGSFVLADDTMLGDMYLYVNVPVPGKQYPETASTYFSVAEYRVPEFMVAAVTTTPDVIVGDTIEVEVSSAYFFGGPVADATVNYTVMSADAYFNYTGDGYYDFTDYSVLTSDNTNYRSVVTSGTAMTDADGKVQLEIPASLVSRDVSARFIIEATTSDSTGFPVSGRVSAVVHTGEFYIGARPTSYVAAVGEPAMVDIVTVNWDSSPYADQTLSVRVVERQWYTVREQDTSGATVVRSEVREIPVIDGERLVTNAEGKVSFQFTPEKPGSYKIYVTGLDNKGNEVRTATYVWASGSGYANWQEENSKRITLVADKPAYEIGDTARILITSPFQGSVEAWVVVERGDILQYDRMTLESNSAVYELPITEDFAPNIFVNVFLVKGVDAAQPVADFRAGYVALNVDRSRKEITLTVEKDTAGATAKPDETVRYTITATDYAGNPVQAEIGAQIVDLAVLSLVEDTTPTLLDTFYGNQALSVATGSALAINTDAITQEITDVFKGGGGGGGGGGGILDVRSELLDTLYWNAVLETDANGVASFDVALPDNLTTWRLTARAINKAVDGKLLVGQTTDDLVSTKPIIVRPVTPRFFVVDDVVTMSAVINNNTSEEQALEVTLLSSGLTFVDGSEATQATVVPANGRVVASWVVRVQDVDAVTAVFSAQGETLADATISPVSEDENGTLPVLRYESPEFVGTSGVLATEGAVEETVILPESQQSTVHVRTEYSLVGAALQAVEALRNTDLDCLECTLSKLLINLMTVKAADSVGADSMLRRQLDAEVSIALQKLFAAQRVDGGWAWYGSSASDVLMSAYALLGLGLARDAGYVVSEEVIGNALSFVRGQFVAADARAETWQLDRQAFVLYVLARLGQPDNGRTSALVDQSERLSIYARALLTQALFMINPGDARINDLINELVAASNVSASGVSWQEPGRDYFNWNTNTRTSAIVLQTLIMTGRGADLWDQAVRYLLVQRRADIWPTTQETMWSLWALLDYGAQSGDFDPQYRYSVAVNDTQTLDEAVSAANATASAALDLPAAELNPGQTNTLTFERSEGTGALYYNVVVEGYLPADEVTEQANGIFVSRRYVMPGSERMMNTARVGDIVEVRLTIIAPTDLHYVVIEDPLPAGTEGINPDLQTSAQLGTQPQLNPSDPLAQGWGWWYFSSIQFKDEKVILSSDYLPAGTYEYVYSVRAAVPGTYRTLPPTAREFYFPDVYGRGSGQVFTVSEAAN
jgi:uncharacterized protein YfaS (alpha-2-macroglobulin family)